jgi:hypothetical protein
MKTSEMIAMLEKDPTLKFWSPQTPIDSYLYVDRYRRITPTIKESEDWKIVLEPVPVWEAIKALKEGQTVTCKCKDCIEPCVLPRHFDVFCSEGIQEGVWYIGEVS